MTGNNYVDKVYLALELTKLSCLNRPSIVDENIYKTFTYFLCKLTSVEDLGIIEDYKNEIKFLTEQNKILSSENQKLKSSCNSSFKTRIDLIKKYINDNGGDMEPDVKTQLLKLLDSIFD